MYHKRQKNIGWTPTQGQPPNHCLAAGLKALSDEVDALEQCSRRNCLLLHGVPESSKDTTEAAIAVFNSRLDLNINNEYIDRSHRLGQPRSDTDSDRPRPIIVKFASYETRR